MAKKATRDWQKWLPVISGMIYCLTIGLMHCFGNLTLYVTSYMRIIGKQNVCYKDLQWIYAISGVFQGIFAFFGGRLEQSFGPRMSALIAGFVMNMGIFLSFLTASNFRGLLITYGIIHGVGSGLAYPIPLAVALRWHPKKKGLVSGLIFVARGLSVFLFTPLQTLYVNPYNRNPIPIMNDNLVNCAAEVYFTDAYVLDRVPSLFLVMGAVCSVLQCISAVLMPNPYGADPASLTMDSEDEDESTNLLNTPSDPLPKLPISFVIRTKQFWFIWLIMFLNWQAVSYVNSFWKVIGQVEFRITDTSLAAIGASVAITNSVGRVVWGTAGDRFGFTATMTCFCFVYSFFLATTPICGLTTSVKRTVLYTVWLNILKIADGGAFTIIPPIAVTIFGSRNFGPVFGLLFTARAISSLVGANFASAFYHLLGCLGMCIFASTCTLVSGLLVMWTDITPLNTQLIQKKFVSLT